VSTISLILLTHPTLSHLGAFAHCCKHIPLFASIPVYATTPVISLGRTLLQDLYASAAHRASIVPASALAESLSKSQIPTSFLVQPPTADDIASYFSLINPLKYSQPHQPIPSPFSPPLQGLTVTAYNAGHTLGGTIWHLQHGLESIVYAVDWNQAKENVLSGAAWLGGAGGGAEVIEQLRRPTAMVCSTKGADRSHLSGGRKKRDDALLALINQTISNGGTVLIPTDSSARVLELAYILEHHWRKGVNSSNQELYKNTKLAFAAKSASATLRYARSMVEWMDDAIAREMEASVQGRSDNTPRNQTGRDEDTPFDLKYLKLVEKKSHLHRILDSEKPAVILASDRSLEWGFSNDAVRKICSDPRNLVVLTERAANPSPDNKGIGRFLWEHWRQQVESRGEDANVVEISGAEAHVQHLDVARLEGDENLLYQQYLARRRQMHSTLQGDNTLNKENAAELADDRSSTTSESSDESENEHQGRALNISATMTHRRKVGLTDAELGINVLLRRKNVYDYDVRNKKGREKVFPFVAKRSRADEFGEVIRPEEYLRAEEKDDTEGQDAAEAKTETAVGQKRKWDEVAPRAIQNGRPGKFSDKRSKSDDRGPTNGGSSTNPDHEMNGDAASESEESDYEPEEALPEGPLKAVFSKQSLQLNLRIAYVDFSGLHEKRDLQMLIPLVRPRKLILVAGEEAETLALAEDCKALLAGEGNAVDILTPLMGETVDASVDTNAWTLKLSREFVKRLAWQNVKGLGIVAVTGRLEAVRKLLADANGDEATMRKKQKMIEAGEESSHPDHSDEAEIEPVLDVLSTNPTISNQITTQPLHVGDLRLADLRKLMQASGHAAEFRGEGTLLVDGAVVVRKTANGRIEIEGGNYMTSAGRHESAFFAVRRRVYEGLAVIAGG
jgi:cleavage and polyadenylation specificity factor subunit 2